MRIFIMGEVGVGKSHAIEHLRSKGYPVIEDPVIELSESFLENGGASQTQAAVAAALYLKGVASSEHIYDSCLLQSSMFVEANANLGHLSHAEAKVLTELYSCLLTLFTKPGDVYIYLDKPENVIREQIKRRGRAYEQGNPFIEEANRVIREKLIAAAEIQYGKENVHSVDTNEGYEELEALIEEIIK